ncbi:uncharacterized protein PV09_04125 [Verruconis gallopava]|uniref:Uncharacterized protein n=1 Tax=Verruconis gallopava TaxID=253628 RepID=A0A0D1YWB2_9PEZI|nr:uncharacterized protein PV09_04125 [Verruconis gallopava]KIW04962.1 hypothetical protein PV09_04125 [Verruconis gallopava]
MAANNEPVTSDSDDSSNIPVIENEAEGVKLTPHTESTGNTTKPSRKAAVRTAPRTGRPRRGTVERTSRKRSVAFVAELDEVRIIGENSTVSLPVGRPTESHSGQSLAQGAHCKTSNYAEGRGDVFGLEDVPRRKELLRALAEINTLQEASATLHLGTAIQIPGPSSPFVSFRDAHSTIEFSVLRSRLGPDVLAAIEAREAAVVDLQWATAAAIWLYVSFLRLGAICETPLHGWEQLCEAYPPLREDSYLNNALLAAVSLAKEVDDERFERCVVTELARVVRAGLGRLAAEGFRADEGMDVDDSDYVPHETE